MISNDRCLSYDVLFDISLFYILFLYNLFSTSYSALVQVVAPQAANEHRAVRSIPSQKKICRVQPFPISFLCT